MPCCVVQHDVLKLSDGERRSCLVRAGAGQLAGGYQGGGGVMGCATGTALECRNATAIFPGGLGARCSACANAIIENL